MNKKKATPLQKWGKFVDGYVVENEMEIKEATEARHTAEVQGINESELPTIPEKEYIKDESLPKIKYRNQFANMLERTVKELKGGGITEGLNTGDVANWIPVLISLIRRTQPALVSQALVGIQPMSQPSSLIFAQHVYYGVDAANGTETWRGDVANHGLPDQNYSGPYDTATGEKLGVTGTATANSGASQDNVANIVTNPNPWPEMTFSITSITVTAKTRALKARMSTEIIDDLRNQHGLDADTELINILQPEIVAETDREIIAMIRAMAKQGASTGTTTAGVFDFDADTDGRWSAEKAVNLLTQIEKEAAFIAIDSQRGLGNVIVTSATVIALLESIGRVSREVDTGVAGSYVGFQFIGILAGRFKLILDPYLTNNEILIGYKGGSEIDAGLFYCPYIPLSVYRATGEEDFGTRIGFKSRYGLAIHPHVAQSGAADTNYFYRKFNVTNI